MARLTIRQAAAMTGLSERTIRRRIKDGTLSAQKIDRDGREVWVIDGGDLAAWAEATGNKVDTTAETHRHGPAPVNDTDQDTDRQTPGNQATQVDTDRHADIDTLQADIDRLQAQVQELQAERDWLRGHVDTLTRALPPAREPAPERDRKRRPWWRFWGGDRDG